MCGLRLEPVTIDDRDPLELDAPECRLEDRSQSAPQQSAQIKEQDRHRELLRDTTSRGSSADRLSAPRLTAASADFPPTTVAEETRSVSSRREPASGIAGPSFLGLGYENGGDREFVYDKPRNDGFIYDTDGEASEYLLEEVPQRTSWRAVALFALLVVGAGLGYIQWRASHNQGPDIAAILAGNGATVDPSGPVMTGNDAKARPKKAEPPAADSPESNSAIDSGSDSSASTPPSDSKDSSDSSTASAKTIKQEDADSNSANESEEANASPAARDNDEAAKPESDEPVAKTTKLRQPKLAPVEATARPKPLGEKDPFILEADRYLHGRGVQQDCAKGINLLHQAMSAGNPAADVKMGALYWSGTCVTQSNVTAYQWFSRAHALEPQNRWIERSRSSLWASLSSEEKRKVSF